MTGQMTLHCGPCCHSAKKLPLLRRPLSSIWCLNKTNVFFFTFQFYFSLMPTFCFVGQDTLHHTPLVSLSPTLPPSLWGKHQPQLPLNTSQGVSEWGLSTQEAISSILLKESLNFSEEKTKTQRNWVRTNIWENWGLNPKP